MQLHHGNVGMIAAIVIILMMVALRPLGQLLVAVGTTMVTVSKLVAMVLHQVLQEALRLGNNNLHLLHPVVSKLTAVTVVIQGEGMAMLRMDTHLNQAWALRQVLEPHPGLARCSIAIMATVPLVALPRLHLLVMLHHLR